MAEAASTAGAAAQGAPEACAAPAASTMATPIADSNTSIAERFDMCAIISEIKSVYLRQCADFIGCP
jgi:hypothetical protein